MAKRLICPSEFRAAAAALNMSPGIMAGDLVFLTGVTGGDAAGVMPDAAGQFETCFNKIEAVLAAADLTLNAIVEMTTYHVGLRDHFDAFDALRLQRLSPPYPAWTAVEVAGLRREGAVIEIRVIASLAA